MLLEFLGTALFLGAIVLSVCSDEISKEEEEKRRRMEEINQSSLRNKKENYKIIRDMYDSRYFAELEEENSKIEEERYKLIKKLKKNNKDNYELISSYLKEQTSTKKEILEQCLQLLDFYDETYKSQRKSYARANTLKASILITQEAVCKLEAYLKYLSTYKKDFVKTYNQKGYLIEGFSLTLPDYIPYVGKTITLDKNDFYEFKYKNGDYGYNYKLNGVEYLLSKFEVELFQNKTQDKLTFMFINEKYKGEEEMKLSLARGLLKHSVNNKEKIDLYIKSLPKKCKYLTVYKDLRYPELFVQNEDLLKPERETPKDTKLQLYVVDYDYSFNSNELFYKNKSNDGKRNKLITLSEKLKDVRVLEKFDEIIIFFSRENKKNFATFLKENDYLNLKSEWRIGPIYDDNNRLTGLIFQMQNFYAFKTKIVQKNPESVELEYITTLKEDELLQFDSVFVATEVPVNCRVWSESEPSKEYKNKVLELNKLLLYLTHEFSHQKIKLERTPIVVFLEQWEKLTERLIEVSSIERMFDLEVSNFSMEYFAKNSAPYFTVELNGNFKKFLKDSKNKNKNYFFKTPNSSENIIFNVEKIKDERTIYFTTRFSEDKIREILKENNFILILCVRGNVEAEKRQLRSFDNFKSGKVVSNDVVNTLQSPKNIGFIDSGIRITKIYNKSILQNKAQLEAVVKAMASKNLFLIQGPPGTGKTTVIKELILQQLEFNKYSKILIVSQANIAVDNVLKGIIKECNNSDIVLPQQIVRCGEIDKIDPAVLDYTLYSKKDDYIKLLKEDNTISQEAEILREKWLNIVTNSKDNKLVTECLINNYQIIGATCVGLASGKYGFAESEFDLVLLDEGAKALAGELLIPINRGKKVIIIGDQKQLPPVISDKLQGNDKLNYTDIVDTDQSPDFLEKSFFERLYNDCSDNMKSMLNIQFRMPLVIADLVNLFYDGTLNNGVTCSLKKPMFLDNHLIFVDMKDEIDYKENDSLSVYNLKEVDAVVQLIKKIQQDYKNRIVVITPYREQKRIIMNKLKNTKNVKVDTIDAFQGDEEDVVIYCTTRATKITKYFSDKKRLNVAFSRARNTLIFVASSRYIKSYGKGHILHQVLEKIQKNGLTIQYKKIIDENFSLNYNSNYNPDENMVKELLSKNNKEYTIEEFTSKLPTISKQSEKYENIVNENHINQQITTKKKCIKCECILNEDFEDKLCYNCLSGKTKTKCTNCRNDFFQSNIEIYLNKNKEKLCYDCVEVNCVNCGASYTIKKDMYNKLPIYKQCKKCNDMIVSTVRCKDCNNTFDITGGDKYLCESKNFTLYIRCKECRTKKKKERM